MPDGSFDRQTKVMLALLSTVVFIAVINGTMINVALPRIGQDFQVSEGTYGWLVTGYSLSFGIFNAIHGSLADIIGKKRLYMFGLLILGGGSLAVAAAQQIEVAIGLRLLQGAGAAALPILGTAIIRQVVDQKNQGRAVGIIMSVVGIAASIGPFLGGAIVQYTTWRVVFLVTGVALLAIPLAWKALPEELNKKRQVHFDWWGALWISLGIGGLLYSFKLLERTGGINRVFLGCLGAAAVCFVLFAWRIRQAKEPFILPSTFKLPSYVLSCAVGMINNGGRFGSVVLVPIMLTRVNHLEPIAIGGVLAPGAVAIALLSSKAGAWADRAGPARPVTLGMGMMVAGSVVTAWFAGGSAWGVMAGLTLFGIGYALGQSPLVANVNRIVPRDQGDAGVGMFMMIFFVGGAAGVAAVTTSLEIQAGLTQSWFGLVQGPGAPFANAALMLGALHIVGVVLALGLPGIRRPKAAVLPPS